jgi:hypothetical protein
MSNDIHEPSRYIITDPKRILRGLKIPEWVNKIVEPFVGNGDLINSFGSGYKIASYDLPEPSKKIRKKLPHFVDARNALSNPPKYEGRFVITSPPYLARDKSEDNEINEIFDEYDQTDLYRCFVASLIKGRVSGGIIILPIDFWSSRIESDVKLRKKFLSKYSVIRINIFEDQVLDDTTSCICSFLFDERGDDIATKIVVYNDEGTVCEIEEVLSRKNHWIGAEIYDLGNKSEYKISRLTRKNIDSPHTNIVADCINGSSKIGLRVVDDKKIYVDKTKELSDRDCMTLVIDPPIGWDGQNRLVSQFTRFIKEQRKKYLPPFLRSYCEFAGKRISFESVYTIVRYLLYKDMASIVSSKYQTSQWRIEHVGGNRRGECENYQVAIVEKVVGELEKTDERIHMEKMRIVDCAWPFENIDGFEYTEDFDRKLKKGDKTYYFNFKFVCGSGGSQTRSLREVYHFIRYQILLSEEKKEKYANTFFINILDGDESFERRKQFKYLLKKHNMGDKVIVCDISEFRDKWSKISVQE